LHPSVACRIIPKTCRALANVSVDKGGLLVANVEVQDRLRQVCAHPLRMRILTALTERVMSPSELAERLSEPLHSVSYHVRRLEELGALELVDRNVKRGTVEHFYRRSTPPIVSDEDLAAVEPDDRRALAAAILEDVWRDTLMALPEHGFSARPDVQLLRMPILLDDEAWAALVPRMLELLEHAQQLSAAALERASQAAGDHGGERLHAARMVMMLFEAATVSD
jgi:DNA-binding transcriptional ArsR family regulator